MMSDMAQLQPNEDEFIVHDSDVSEYMKRKEEIKRAEDARQIGTFHS